MQTQSILFSSLNMECVTAFLFIPAILILYIVFLFINNLLTNKYAITQFAFSYKPVLKKFFYSKLSGFVIYGIVPFLAALLLFKLSPAEIGLQWFAHWTDILIVILLIVVVCVFTKWAASSEKNIQKYPQIKLQTWTVPVFITSYLGWVIYLLAYELLFRGILLNVCLPFGTWPAIAINCVVYAIVHVHQDKSEFFGAIVFGIVLCLLTIYTGTILAPFLVHLSLSISTEIWSIKNNPRTHVFWIQIPTL